MSDHGPHTTKCKCDGYGVIPSPYGSIWNRAPLSCDCPGCPEEQPGQEKETTEDETIDIVDELYDWAAIIDQSKGHAVVVMLSGDIFTRAAEAIEALRNQNEL